MTITLESLIPFVSALSAIIAALVTLGFALTVNRERINRSRYDEHERRAVLSMMRDTYEDRIADLTEKLTSTQSRWQELNHLLLDAQRVQGKSSARNDLSSERFLRGFGIDLAEVLIDPKLAFILTPFTKSEQRTFEAIQKGCSNAAFRAVRGDEERITGPILPHILRQIASARVIVANISTRNPNVFYELGIAQALGKPTILVSRSVEDVPFDLQSTQIIQFSDIRELSSKVSDEIRKVIADDW